MFGQILTGLAQPFVLSAPTRYSDLWFTNRGRVAATAVMSLANPFGGALAQLIDPNWAGNPGDIPNMVLYIAIIVSLALQLFLYEETNAPSHLLHLSPHFSFPPNHQRLAHRPALPPSSLLELLFDSFLPVPNFT
jgi:hypothetical protein